MWYPAFKHQKIDYIEKQVRHFFAAQSTENVLIDFLMKKPTDHDIYMVNGDSSEKFWMRSDSRTHPSPRQFN